jgi:predicted nucleic acid-binding protein
MQNASMRIRAIVDTSYLVGALDPLDVLYSQARAMQEALNEKAAQLVYTDCVVSGAINVFSRRSEERKRPELFSKLIDELYEIAPPPEIAWIYPQVQRWYALILERVRSSQGRLNFNDALLILAAQEMGVSAIVSFDRDFDDVPGLIRLHRPEDIP